MKNVTGQEKASAKLSCRLSAVPKEVCWFKGQTALVASSKYIMKQSGAEVQLVIQALTPDDAGEYRCNSETFETKAMLAVEGKVVYAFWYLFPSLLLNASKICFFTNGFENKRSFNTQYTIFTSHLLIGPQRVKFRSPGA